MLKEEEGCDNYRANKLPRGGGGHCCKLSSERYTFSLYQVSMHSRNFASTSSGSRNGNTTIQDYNTKIMTVSNFANEGGIGEDQVLVRTTPWS